MDTTSTHISESPKKNLPIWLIIGGVVLLLIVLIGIFMSKPKSSSETGKSVSAKECDQLMSTYDKSLYTVKTTDNRLRGTAGITIDKEASCKVSIQYLFYFYDSFLKNGDTIEYLYAGNLIDPSAKKQSDEGTVFAITCGSTTDLTALEFPAIQEPYRCPTYQANRPVSRFYLSFTKARSTGQRELIENAISGKQTIEVFDLSPYPIVTSYPDGTTGTSYDLDKAIQEGNTVGSYAFSFEKS